MSAITEVNSALTALGFIRMDGLPEASGPMMKDISSEGVPGRAYMRYAYCGKPFRLTTRAAVAASTDVALLQILYAQYQTRNVSITDDMGNTWANMFVLSARVTGAQKIVSGVGDLSGMSYLVYAEWEIQSAAVSY